jgi:hypothetical protein
VLGTTITLPSPWNEVTNTCTTDADCTKPITLDVGALTGLSFLNGLSFDYPMPVCESFTVAGQTCGMCVPCRTNADCESINLVVDTIQMTCANIAGDYGVCVPSL